MSPSRGQKNRAVTEHSPMVSGLDADKKTLPSELHGKSRIVSANTTGCLDILSICFRLARNNHRSQPTDIHTDRYHIGCQNKIIYIPVPAIVVRSLQPILNDICNIRVVHSAGKFHQMIIAYFRISG